MNRGTTTVAPQLPNEAGQGPSDSGRPLVPFDPWADTWSPPDEDALARKHALARRRERQLARFGHRAPADDSIDLTHEEPQVVVERTVPREEPARPRRRSGRLLGAMAAVATAYWYFALGTILIALAIPLASGWDASTVITGSMEPAISPGDVVAVSPYAGEPLGIGAIIQFADPVHDGATVTHRIVGVNGDGTYVTRGDANAAADSTPVPPDAIVGVARMISPNAGLPQVWWMNGKHLYLAAWAVVTVASLGIMTIHSNRERSRPRKPRPRRERRAGRSILRPAIALGIVASIAGVGTAAWSQARFVAAADIPASTFAAASFAEFSHTGSLGVAACSTTSQSSITLGMAVPVGDTIVIRFALRDLNGGSAYSAWDSAGNTYTVDAVANDGSRTEAAVLSAHVTTALAVGDQITLTHPDGRAVVAAFDAFGGIAATDRVAAVGAGSGNDQSPSISVALPDAPALTIGHIVVRDVATVNQPVAGWNALESGPVSCNRSLTHRSAWNQANAASTVTYSPTFDAKNRWSGLVVAYRTG